MSSFEWLLSADSTALLIPSPALPNFRCNHSSLHTGSERKLGQKISVKTNSKVGGICRKKKNNNLTNTCGSEAISHTAVQDPRVSVPCIMKLQLNVFCSV